MLFGWILLVIGVTAVSQLVGTRFQNNFTAGDTPSQQAAEHLGLPVPGPSGDTADVVFHTPPRSPRANRAAIERVVRRLVPLSHVVGVTSPFSPAGGHQVASSGHLAYAVVQFNTTSDHLPATAVNAVIATAEAARHPGFAVALGGARSPR